MYIYISSGGAVSLSQVTKPDKPSHESFNKRYSFSLRSFDRSKRRAIPTLTFHTQTTSRHQLPQSSLHALFKHSYTVTTDQQRRQQTQLYALQNPNQWLTPYHIFIPDFKAYGRAICPAVFHSRHLKEKVLMLLEETRKNERPARHSRLLRHHNRHESVLAARLPSTAQAPERKQRKKTKMLR